MNWRCAERRLGMRCQLAPGHTDSHQAIIISGEEISYLFWFSEPDPAELVAESPVVPDAAPAIQEPEPMRVPVRYGPVKIEEPWRHFDGVDGRKRDGKHLSNLYAAFNEGIHTSWGMYGHEVRPHPMLDDLEKVIF